MRPAIATASGYVGLLRRDYLQSVKHPLSRMCWKQVRFR